MPQPRTARSAQRPRAARSAHQGRVALVLISVALLILGGLGALALKGGSGADRSTAPAATPSPTVDPRLVLHPHRVAIAAALAHDLRLTGTMTPDLPGNNAFDVTLRGPLSSHARGGAPLRLEARMPGMAMPPLRAALANHGRRFSGALALPMFGTYRLAVAVSTTAGMVTGVLTVTIPLPAL